MPSTPSATTLVSDVSFSLSLASRPCGASRSVSTAARESPQTVSFPLIERGHGAPHTSAPRGLARPTVPVRAEWAPAPTSKATRGHLNDICQRPTHHYEKRQKTSALEQNGNRGESKAHLSSGRATRSVRLSFQPFFFCVSSDHHPS